MAESTVTADSKLTSSDTRRRIWAIVGASSGNLVEWFDFYVYSFCSLYFAHIFFPPGTRRLNYYKQQVFLLRDS
ncbi:alpha-ketoglutarate permease [Escherichia coli DEC9C]|nr:alpha-ketoglutarate permease [Escherichia coli DEC9C]